MILAFVSDERYVALADVALEFLDAKGGSWEARSRASGAVHVDLPTGEYEVVLQKPGFGAKRVRLSHQPGRVHHLRLLADGLLGYAWPKCVRGGAASERLSEKGSAPLNQRSLTPFRTASEFRVHSTEPYKLELWRYGWDKEFVQGLGWHDEHGPRAVMQVTPDGDYSQSGAEWNKVGYLSPHHQQRVQAPDRSGLYYFHASTKSGAAFAFPWVVAPATPRAPVAVLASDITWNAYNNFGGRSNYIHADALPSAPTVNARQELKRYQDVKHLTWGCDGYAPLSLDRPEPLNHIDLAETIIDPIEGRSACHLAPAEWRLLGWLEREDFPYDYYAETQLHHGMLDLSRYRVLILSTHPEYWTRKMYDRVKAWVFEEGGRLLYLGGNGLNCEVEFLDEATMVCRNTSISSLWPEGMGGAESRFARRHESEANLLGVVFTPAGIMTGAPYRVLDASHWIFQDTGLKNGELFGQHSLHMRCPGGASGHETDKVSANSPRNVQVLARGTNPDNGGAEMVLFDTPSGGAVFSAGSICYPSSLPVDVAVSRVTANVLRRFLE